MMHEIDRFGGRRIRENETRCIVVQFDSGYNMDRWLRMMRCSYNTNTFSPAINKDALTVAY